MNSAKKHKNLEEGQALDKSAAPIETFTAGRETLSSPISTFTVAPRPWAEDPAKRCSDSWPMETHNKCMLSFQLLNL